MKIKNLGEMGLIERLARGIRLDKSVVKGIGDDTAVIKSGICAARNKFLQV